MLASRNKKNDSTIPENMTNKSPGISSFGAPQFSLIELDSYFSQVNASLLAETVVIVWQPKYCTNQSFNYHDQIIKLSVQYKKKKKIVYHWHLLL